MRNQVLRKVLNTLKDEYERKQNESTRVSRIKNETDNVRFRGKLAGQRGNPESFRGGDRRNGDEVDTQYSPHTAPMSEEEQIRIYLRQKHLKNKEDIRKKYRAYRSAARMHYNEERT